MTTPGQTPSTEQAIAAQEALEPSLPGPGSPESPTAPSSLAGARPDLDAIYDAEARHVWNCLRRLGVADKDLEDALHDVFLVLHSRLADYDPTRPVRPWLNGMAVRVAANYRRRVARHGEVFDDAADSRPAGGPDVEEQAAANETRTLVRTALGQLDDKQRTVLVLHDVEGHSMPDIARELEVPLNTLYSRLRLARAHFQDLVRRAWRGGGKP